MYSALSTFNTTTEKRPMSKVTNPQMPQHWLATVPVCVHYCVLCVEHKFRVWVTILGHMSLQNSKSNSMPYNIVTILQITFVHF